MPKTPQPPDPKGVPERIAPDDALPDVLERVVLRRQVQVELGDVVVTRERVPRLNPHATIALPWRYRVAVYPEPAGHTYTSFQHAASAAEDLATGRHARVIYLETDQPTLLADYRK